MLRRFMRGIFWTVTLVLFGTAVHADISTGLVASYPFSGNADDVSGNGNNGIVNGATLTADRFGNASSAYSFAGAQSIIVPHSSSIDFGTGSFSVSVWFKTSQTDYNRYLISKGFFSSRPGWGMVNFSDYTHSVVSGLFDGTTNTIAEGVNYYTDNTWHHMTMVRNTSNHVLETWVDGVMVASSDDGTISVSNVYNLLIGSLPPEGGPDISFIGSLDDVSIYNRALTATDVKKLFGFVNTAPIADAGEDQSLTLIGSTVQLDGTQSFDGDGDLLNYSWSFVSIPQNSCATFSDKSSPKPTFSADTHGAYLIQLTVTDPDGASSTDTVVVSFENIAPIAHAGFDQSVIQGSCVHLDGGKSSDGNNDFLLYAWRLISMPAGSNAVLGQAETINPSFVPDLKGQYVISLVVDDGIAVSAPSIVTVTAISYQDATLESLLKSQSLINQLNSCSLQNYNAQKTLGNKISATMKLVSDNSCTDAWEKIEYDLIAKTDGCSIFGTPDKNDWITDCDAQANTLKELSNAASNIAGDVNWSSILPDIICTMANVGDIILTLTYGYDVPVSTFICQLAGGKDTITPYEIKIAPVSRPSLIVNGKVVFGDPKAVKIIDAMENGM